MQHGLLNKGPQRPLGTPARMFRYKRPPGGCASASFHTRCRTGWVFADPRSDAEAIAIAWTC